MPRPKGKRFTPEEIIELRQRAKEYRQLNPDTSVDRLCKDLDISQRTYYTKLTDDKPLPPKVRRQYRKSGNYSKITAQMPVFNQPPTDENVTVYVFKGNSRSVLNALAGVMA
jgi:hypothetical protein